MISFSWLNVTPERYRIIKNEITEGSEPGVRFYIMVAVSTLIAGFGLTAGSTEVVIGAMLVAPLMTPIFGIAFALIRGDTKLLGHAISAEALGVVLAIMMGLLLGLLHPAIDPTPEMLARTKPNLIDLFVAVLAGFAGAYALLDEHISPALPGVAIAVAIVPPLANTGLCLSLGAYDGATGSFLLFFANFLSILLIGSLLFVSAGLMREFTKKAYLRRFGLAAVSFLVLAVFLGQALIKMVEERNLHDSIRASLVEELSSLPATSMESTLFKRHGGKLLVLAEVNSPQVIAPRQVKRIQNKISKSLDLPTKVIIRTSVANDVSASGSTSLVNARDIDGSFLSRSVHPNVEKTMIAEQIIRDYLSTQLGLNLQDVELLNLEGGSVILATITGFRKLTVSEIVRLEATIRNSAMDQDVSLVIRYVEMEFYDKDGMIHYEFASLKVPTKEHQEYINNLRQAVRNEIENHSDLFLKNVSIKKIGKRPFVLIELSGPRMITQSDYNAITANLSCHVTNDLQLYLRWEPEVVMTESGYKSYSTISSEVFANRDEPVEMELLRLLEPDNL